jgi:bifunctional DNase/RNase
MDHEAEIAGVGIGVGRGDDGDVPMVVLSARDEYLPIAVTRDQAQSIELSLADESFGRPLTHDLLVEMVTEFGGAFDRVRIDALTDGTFYAKVDLQRYADGDAAEFTFDARPSDAIALATRADCAILVDDGVLDEAGRPPSALDFDEEGTRP